MNHGRFARFADLLRLVFPLLLLLSLAITWKFLDASVAQRISDTVKSIPNTPWAIFAVIGTYCLLSLFVFPISILLYGTILTFGLFPGMLYSFAGTMSAAILNYYLGAWFSQHEVFRFLERRKLSDLKEALRNPSLATIMIIRLTPVAPFTVENYLAGAVGVRPGLYILGTFLGLTPGILSIGLITTALSPYVQNPLYYIPIYFGMSSVLLALIVAGKKIAGACARFSLHRRLGSIIYTKLEQIKGVDLYFKDHLWLASYISQVSYGIEGQSYFVKVGGPNGSDALLLFQRITVTPKELLGYVKARGSLGKSVVRKVLQFFLQNRRITILVNGCPNLTGDFRFVSKPDDLDDADALVAALRKLKNVIDFDAVIIKDIHPPLKKVPAEFKKFQVDPNMVVHNTWPSVEAYVAAMRTKYRQRYQSTMRKSAAISMQKLNLTQIAEHKAEINGLLAKVVKQDKFNLEQIPDDYFLRLAGMQQFSLYGYFLDDRLVAFRSSLEAADRLIAHYVGFESDVNTEQKIYQRMLYDYVAEGIEKKLPAIHLGRTALEIKSTVGAEREDYYLMFHSDNWFYRTVGNYYVSRLAATGYEARSPFRDE
ncbi:MAG TPA: VTT domain-containing protein [Turneriella sp.]|nr:VTT domain-containing protein [Turneriella sp.]